MANGRFTYKHVTREKVIWSLLFITLISSVFVICVLKWTPTLYQAEENNNITIKWDSQIKTNTSVTNLICALQSKHPKVLYQMREGVQVSESQHQQFAGRVQLDTDALREGQISLHLSTVTAEDSGDYRCDLGANFDKNTGRWELAATGHFVLNVIQNSHGDIRDTSSATEGPQPAEGSQQDVIWIIATAALGTLTVAATVVFVAAIVVQLHKPDDKKPRS